MGGGEPYRLRFALEAGAGVCLWAANDRAKALFGYAVGLDSLPVPADLDSRLRRLMSRFDGASAAQAAPPDSAVGAVLFGYEPEAAALADEVVACVRELRAALGPAFVIEHDFASPEAAFRAGWNRRWTPMAALGGVGFCLLSAWLVNALAFESFGSVSPFSRVLLTVMFAAFALLFAAVAATYVLATFDAAPVVIVDGRGVFDRRLSREPIAWSDITSMMPLMKGGQLMLVLGVAGRRRLPANPLWVVNRLSARLSGTEFAVRMTGLDTSIQAVIEAIQARAPARDG